MSLQEERDAARAQWEAAGRPAIVGMLATSPVYGTRAKRPRRARPSSPLRPLKKVRAGGYKSADGRWYFCRLLGDPRNEDPCWYAYEGDEGFPTNTGTGITRLRDVVAWAERHDALAAGRVQAMGDTASPALNLSSFNGPNDDDSSASQEPQA